jgi:two-component system, LytTR family, sensor kinase
MLNRRPTPPPTGDAGDPPQHDEPAAAAGESRARSVARQAVWVALGWTLVGVAQAVVWRISGRAEYEGGSFLYPAALPMMAAWTWAALTPVVLWITRRLGAARLPLVVAGHVAGVLFACLVLTAVRVATIQLLDVPAWAPRQFVFWMDVNVATYLLVAAAARAVDLHRGYAARMRRAIRLEAQLARARLQFLQRQLQPHFLFNCLNATAELTREAPEAAQRMLGHLARLLRAALEHQGDGEVTLRAELDALEPYVEIQRTRFGDAFDFAAHVAPSALDARVPSLLLQPLVENAFRHGLAGRDRGRVRVRAAVWPSEGNPRLRVEVTDDGAGTGAHQLPKGAARNGKGAGGGSSSTRRSGGIGLRNTRDRLRQLYGDDFRFELRQTPGTGTVVLLDIPYRPADAADVEPDTRFDTAEYAAVTAAASWRR